MKIFKILLITMVLFVISCSDDTINNKSSITNATTNEVFNIPNGYINETNSSFVFNLTDGQVIPTSNCYVSNTTSVNVSFSLPSKTGKFENVIVDLDYDYITVQSTGCVAPDSSKSFSSTIEISKENNNYTIQIEGNGESNITGIFEGTITNF